MVVRRLQYLVDTLSGTYTALNGCRESSQDASETLGDDYKATRFQAKDLPPKVDMKAYLTQVEDQASANSCTANAIVGGYEYILKRVGKNVDFSRLFLYYNARAKYIESVEGGKGVIVDDGSSIGMALWALDEKGVCLEKTWDYIVLPGKRVANLNTRPSDEAYLEAMELKTKSVFQWETPEKVSVDLFAMKHCLAEGYPFVFGLKLFKSFDVAKHRGRVPMPSSQGEKAHSASGVHAMLCVGYKDKAQYFIVRNSWGSNWGDGGYCYVPYDYLANADFVESIWKIKGQVNMDLSKNIWFDQDDDFGEEFYEDFEIDNLLIFSIEEAICCICFIGAGCDGVSEEENEKLIEIFQQYGIDTDELESKINRLVSVGDGLTTCHDVACRIILAHDQAMLAYRVSAEFVFADGKVTRDEQKYWDKLAADLNIPPHDATSIFDELYAQNPHVQEDWTILRRPLGWFARGEQVKRLQEALNEEGGNISVTCFVGPETRLAVTTFQEQHGLEADGVVRQDMWDILFTGGRG